MTPTEQQILETLQEMNSRIGTAKSSATRPDLLPLFESLDELSQRLADPSQARLRHYLERKSYEKALLWLQGREEENRRGFCAS